MTTFAQDITKIVGALASLHKDEIPDRQMLVNGTNNINVDRTTGGEFNLDAITEATINTVFCEDGDCVNTYTITGENTIGATISNQTLSIPANAGSAGDIYDLHLHVSATLFGDTYENDCVVTIKFY